MRELLKLTLSCLLVAAGIIQLNAVNYTPENTQATLALKVPGNDAKIHPMTLAKLNNGGQFNYEWCSKQLLPVKIMENVEEKDGNKHITIMITAKEDVYFNFGQQVITDMDHKESLF
ncbi:MAG: hypothetical protein RR868_08970, partial [Muribaculaceae bacterium]